MRSILLVLTVLFFNDINAQGIVFETGTWEEALKKAEKENKIIFVDAYTTWCGPCKAMAANVFTLSEAGSFYNSNFINVKMDMESPEGRTFGKKYPVTAYPTLLFIDAEGNVVKRVVGGQKLEGLLATGTEALKSGGGSIATLEEKYKKGERSYSFMLKYMAAMAKNGQSTTKILTEYLQNNTQLKETEKAMLLFEGSVEADSKIFDEMVKLKKTIIEIVSVSKFEEKVEEACRRTAKKAIEFELNSLLEESVAKAKQNLTINKSLENELKMDYYKSFKDEKSYLANAESLISQILKNNPQQVKTVIKDMCSSFKESNTIKSKAASFAQDLYKKNPNPEFLEFYCTTLVINGEKEKAFKEIDKSKKSAKNDEELIKKIEIIYHKVKELQ
jgi:thiol-disulfide isomerase/thioredoxin